MDAIFETVKLGSKTHQRGGGIGYDLSNIRPKGSPTSNDAVASGPVSFMDVFNAQTATILQGNRRGANMGVLNVYHPDILDFIHAKSYDAGKLNHFNLSVMADDEFMHAVEEDKEIFLHWPVYTEDGRIERDPSRWKISKKIRAADIWDAIMKGAYDNGEPGIFQYNNMNRDNNLWYIENIVCSNPCSEYLSGTLYGYSPVDGAPINPKNYGGACNPGSLMLHNFVIYPFTETRCVDYEGLRDAIRVGVRFLDNIIDLNKFPDKIYENYQKSFRTIGLGTTGLGDMLAMLGYRYDSAEARGFVDDLFDFIALTAYNASIDLAIERGAFPFFDKEKFVKSNYLVKHCKESARKDEWVKTCQRIEEFGIRNAKILSVAQTGTMSLVFGNNCSSGIEPIFKLEFSRKVKVGGQSEDDAVIVRVVDYAYDLWLQTPEYKRAVDKDIFVVALDMDVDDHVDMLATIAYHIDMSVSKTINVPTAYPYEKTKDIYMKCWKAGIKGCTIFRPNPLRQGILYAEPQESNSENDTEPELKRGEVVRTSDGLIGLKRRLMTGCGTLHCSAFFDPVTGDLMETYLSKGSTGGCLNSLTGLSRMISLSARGGMTLNQIADQLDSCGVCPSYAVRTATKHDTSKGACCPSAIGYALLDMHHQIMENVVEYNPDLSADDENAQSAPAVDPCPECGEELVHEGSCRCCKNCGWSKCE